MRYLDLDQVIQMHNAILSATGGAAGVRDLGGLESALALPQMDMFGQELYPSIVEKAAILGFAIITNHPFIDGNKRIGHAAMETFLMLNGYEVMATEDNQEEMILQVAAGECSKEGFTEWLKNHIREFNINDI
jgi:death-on-curing protein